MPSKNAHDYLLILRSVQINNGTEVRVQFIMVIESSEWSAIWSEITSMISDQNCTTRSYYIHFVIAHFNSLNTRTTRFWSVSLYIEPVAGLSKSETRNAFTSHFKIMSTSRVASCDWLFCFTVLFLLAEKDAI